MRKSEEAQITELTWDQARLEMIKVNPELTKIIDEINPDKKHTLFKVRYPYGSEILKTAAFYLPNKLGNLVPIDDSSIDSHIQQSLSYNLKSNPVFMILNNSLELFLPLETRTIPFSNLITPGRLVGTHRLLTTDKISHHPAFVWDMTAGARSIFLLPKISDMERYTRLRKTFSIACDKPKSYIDHWKIFTEIANNNPSATKWAVEIFFFSQRWFEHLTDRAWIVFTNYLLQKAWNSRDYWQSVFIWNMIFALIQEKLGIKPSPYTMGTVKHLLTIAVGEAPAFAPAIDNSTGPIAEIQTAFADIYGLNYAPIIMQPCSLLLNASQYRPVYYSLNFDNAMEFWPKSRERNSLVNELCEIRDLLKNYIKEITTNELNVKETPLYELLNQISFDYFHNDVELRGFGKSANIAKLDPTFFMPKICQNKTFPLNSAFFKGCIRIEKNKPVINSCTSTPPLDLFE